MISENRDHAAGKVWDERYAQAGAFGDDPNDFLKSQASLFHRGQKVLSLGEGEGRNAIWLAQLGANVTAVDLSAVAMNRLAARANELKLPITTAQANLETWPIAEGEWDVILSIWCHLPSELRRFVHKQVVAGLRPNGLFVLEAYTPGQLARGTGGPASADFLPSAANLLDELAGLEVARCEESSRMVHEGNRHNGISDVVQFVGRKPAP